MKVKFGTSGLRGLASSLIGEPARRHTAGFLRHLMATDYVQLGGAICLAWDYRQSSPALVNDVSAVVADMGLRLVRCGAVPTPALANYAMQRNLASIMITGSHIPADRNGIKFYLPNGEISKIDEEAIINLATLPLPNITTVEKTIFDEDAFSACESEFVERYNTTFGSSSLKGLTIGVYQHSTVARDLLVEVLENAGAVVISLDRSKTFIPVDTEAVSNATKRILREWAATNMFDAIVSADGDGDRPLVADESGHLVPGDILGLLTSCYLNAETVVSPITSNSGLDSALGRPVRRTRVGSPFVISEMLAALSKGEPGIVGFEANGGFLTMSYFTVNGAKLPPLPTRDCFLPILAVLASAKEKGCKLSHLSGSYKLPVARGDRLENFPIETSTQLMVHLQSSTENMSNFFASAGRITSINKQDGLRIGLDCGSVIHLRPSGNAPEFRCYVEAPTADAAEELLKWGLNAIVAYADGGNNL
jgi:phosphomannomutase